MPAQKTAPFATWKSAITADVIVSETVGLDMITTDGGDIYWLEVRPNENGRGVIVKHSINGKTRDVTPTGFHVGSRAHEYGGGAYAVKNGTVCFSNYFDQRLYKQDPGSPPVPLTSNPDTPGALRFADLLVDPLRQQIIAVCEDHSTGAPQPINSLVSVPLDGSGKLSTVASGHDFYSSPKLSGDGSKLAWLSWDHPNMPWDGTELTVAKYNREGSVSDPVVIAGSSNESIFQPEWSADGDLLFASDRTDWWNLYRYSNGQIEALCPREAEFARAQWVFGLNTYTFGSSDTIICTFNRGAIWKLARLDLRHKNLTEIKTAYTDISWPKVSGNRLIFRGASPQKLPAIVALDLSTGDCQQLKAASSVCPDEAIVSQPEIIEFPTSAGQSAYAFYYAPRNSAFIASDDERPPLLVKSHGGPTSTLSSALALENQFWTSRGFAVVDVNYGGSTGYGRRFRDRLYGQWGIVDVDDCTNAAAYLTERGLADPHRLLISGRSASGFTTLCALTFKNVFCGGASYYGISDLVAIASDTHKFELHYVDKLIGPYPARRDLYMARSPINSVDQINCPIVFFQGLEDKVVPPTQTQAIVDALKQKGLPVACLIFKEERHGFRKAETIKRALESELSFYCQIFGVRPADDIAPLVIENLGSKTRLSSQPSLSD